MSVSTGSYFVNSIIGLTCVLVWSATVVLYSAGYVSTSVLYTLMSPCVIALLAVLGLSPFCTKRQQEDTP